MPNTYVLSDYARAAADALGPEWGAESGFLGACGLIFTVDGRLSLRLFVDAEGDMCLFEHHDDEMPSSEWHWIRTENLPDVAPRTPDEIAVWGQAIAAAIEKALPDTL